jgi:hypothetical protein
VGGNFIVYGGVSRETPRFCVCSGLSLAGRSPIKAESLGGLCRIIRHLESGIVSGFNVRGRQNARSKSGPPEQSNAISVEPVAPPLMTSDNGSNVKSISVDYEVLTKIATS